MIRREKRHVEACSDRRLEHLEERVDEDPSLTWDRAEAAALRFALAVVAGAEETGAVEDLHERGKELIQGPERLSWLEGGHKGATPPDEE